MDILIREQLDGASGFETFQDTELQGERISIGSAPDQQIQLLGDGIGARAAEIVRSGGDFVIKSAGKTPLTVNGKPVRSATLKPGTIVELGGNRIEVIESPPGFDLALLLRRSAEADGADFERAFVTSLEQGGLSMRRWAWGMAAAVLLLAFALPLASLYLRDAEADAPRWLPSDALWTSGPLHPVHALAAGDNCSLCHSDPFVQVQDKDCSECHEEVEDHLSPKLLDAHPENAIRCASCHREHNEPASTLIVRADSLCTDCHADDEKMDIVPELETVSGFDEQRHPGFRARLLKPGTEEGEKEKWVASREPLEKAKEQSNLKFPHDVHLDAEKVTWKTDDEPLVCADCHELNNDREHFAKITMERRCAECHELTFDPAFPDRQLPHGKPEEVIFTLEGHYLKRLSDPDYKPVRVKKRRRPDQRKKRPLVCNDPTYGCALQKAARDTEDQFTRRGCVSCHEVAVYPERDLYFRYDVKPVRLASDYFPDARFDHGSHRNMKYPDDEKTLSGDAACKSCHEADASKESSDLLLPDRDNCASCHRSERASDIVPMQCISCHAYHPAPDVRAERSRSLP